MIFRLRSESKDSFDVEHVIREATVAEKVALLSGKDFWHTTPLPRFNVPSVRFSDGPNGVRGTRFFNGVSAACLPCGTGLAATWDTSILQEAGNLIGEECKAKGGRGFESMSEDPYATGKLAASYIKGVQETGIISTIKHWLANDQEHERVAVNVMVDERALREIHMLPFQIAFNDARPGAIMTCYNKVNGLHVSENRELLDGILREDWNWNGLIVSDWFGTYSTAEAINAGLDLEMPGPTRLRGALADLAVSTRKVSRSTIDTRARNVLDFVKKASQVEVADEEGCRNFLEDRILNRRLAADSVVLLKNQLNMLPLRRTMKTIALIGPNMKNVAFCGGGSAALKPYYTVSVFDGISSKLSDETNVIFEPGVAAYGYIPLLTSNDVTTPEGIPGWRMRFYKDAYQAALQEIVEELIINESSWQLMGYSNPRLNSLFYAVIEADFVPKKSGIYTIGAAVYGTMKVFLDDSLVIDNATRQTGGSFWFGKGTHEEKVDVKLVQGQIYRIRIEFASAPSSTLVKPGVVNFGGGAGRLGLVEKLDEDVAISNAVQAASSADVTIISVGLTSDWESEGFDRKDMHLPGSLVKMINAVLRAKPDTVVITQSGTPFDMSAWSDDSQTHLHAWYGGNEVGNGIADVLFGDVNPNGKLPLTFPRRLEDTPTFLNFGSERGRVVYGESIYIGYRYYEKLQREVLYPFGHGLSYTTFAYRDLQVTTDSIVFELSNTGSIAGAEVGQMYIGASPATSSIARPKKELKGFSKVFLQPGQMQKVEIKFDKFSFVFWDEVLHAWVQEKGSYGIFVGSSSADIRLEGTLDIHETTSWTGL